MQVFLRHLQLLLQFCGLQLRLNVCDILNFGDIYRCIGLNLANFGLKFGNLELCFLLSLMAPSRNLDSRLGFFPEMATYPWSVKAEAPVDEERMFSLLRDYFQGSPYDLSSGLASGPFHTPARYDIPAATLQRVPGGFERSISTYRTTFSFVIVSRPSLASSSFGSLFWYGQDSPWGSCYTPVYGAQNTVPSSFTSGQMSEYDPNSAYWIFNFLNNWAQLRWDHIQPEMLTVAMNLEAESLAQQQDQEREALQAGDGAMALLEAWSKDRINTMVDTWKDLTLRLIAKYHNGWLTRHEGPNTPDDQSVSTVGYSDEWLKSVGFAEWPGDTLILPAMEAEPAPATAAGLGGFVATLFLVMVFISLAALFALRRKQHTAASTCSPPGAFGAAFTYQEVGAMEMAPMPAIRMNGEGGVPKFTTTRHIYTSI